MSLTATNPSRTCQYHTHICWFYICHITTQVFKQKMFMRLYGAMSCKPTTLWSNSSLVGELDLGAIPKDSCLNIFCDYEHDTAPCPLPSRMLLIFQGPTPEQQASGKSLRGCPWTQEMLRRQAPPPGESDFCHQLSATNLLHALPACMLWMWLLAFEAVYNGIRASGS